MVCLKLAFFITLKYTINLATGCFQIINILQSEHKVHQFSFQEGGTVTRKQ